MTAAARKKSALAFTATALLALSAPLALSGQASAASVSTWEKVAQCESSGNWSINTGNGYYGGLQFSESTWLSYGGSQYASYPNQATEQQQILIAEKVLASQGQGAWPTCGPAAGLGSDTANPYPVSTSYPDPSALPSGTLVKSPNGPAVKVLISGAGLAVSSSDVAPDGYDLSKVVTVDDSAFNALPTTVPAGTVVHDQAGGAARYVVVAGTALPISGSDWTADGYNTRSDMGVPSSWLGSATQGTLPSGLVVHDQAGGANRYVMVGGVALQISGTEWTADGYNTRSDMGVPSSWLASATQGTLPAGILVQGQAGTSPAIYEVVNNTALPITGAEWTADGFNTKSLFGVPESWLQGAVAKPLNDGTVVKDISGASPTVYVMAGGMAVPLTNADFTGMGYDKQSLMGVPGTWLNGAAAKTAPSDGTLLQSPDSTTVWLVTGGNKKAAAAGSYNAANVVAVPTALTAKLPTVTS